MSKSLYEAVKKQFSTSAQEKAKLAVALAHEHEVEKVFNSILVEHGLEKSSIFILDFIEEWIFAIDGHPQGVEDFNTFVATFRKANGETQLALLVKASDIVFEKLKSAYKEKLELRPFKMCLALIKARTFDKARAAHAKNGKPSDKEAGSIIT